MTNSQLSQAMTIVKSDDDLSHIDDSILHGLALKGFVPVTTTIEVVAKFLRWHVMQLNGEVDAEELNTLAKLLRHRVTII